MSFNSTCYWHIDDYWWCEHHQDICISLFYLPLLGNIHHHCYIQTAGRLVMVTITQPPRRQRWTSPVWSCFLHQQLSCVCVVFSQRNRYQWCLILFVWTPKSPASGSEPANLRNNDQNHHDSNQKEAKGVLIKDSKGESATLHWPLGCIYKKVTTVTVTYLAEKW